MRLWRIHPRYLDNRGLWACYREGLKLLQSIKDGGKYHHRPQVDQFKVTGEATKYLCQYLCDIWNERWKRGKMNENWDLDQVFKFYPGFIPFIQLEVMQGQISFEFELLQRMLKKRCFDKWEKNCKEIHIIAHPLFKIIPGPIEAWEKGRG